jgi:Cu(I)/Ag(I) efflux system membrane fusion protein
MVATSSLFHKPQRPPAPARRPFALWRYLLTAARVLQVRLRFFLVLLVAFVVVGKWDVIRNYWDRLTRPAPANDSSRPISLDTEYFCPMCPGVLSDWPGRCPVCNMSLVRRKKGDATPLPDGVVARMQLSPYRLQLAGVQTAPVGYQPLVREISLVGFVADEARVQQVAQPAGSGRQVGQPAPPSRRDPSKADVLAEVFDADLPFLAAGQAVEATSDAYPGRHFTGELVSIRAEDNGGLRFLQARLAIEDPGQELRPGLLMNTRLRLPLARFEPLAGKQARERVANTVLLALAPALFEPMHSRITDGIASPFEAGFNEVCRQRNLALAVPESAVIDSGTSRLVYVQSGPEMFDGIDVVLSPRCGSFYPVLGGLQAGQRVAVSGAFLIDAETRLNPGTAASYFGASASAASTAPPAPPASSRATAAQTVPATDGLFLLDAADQVLAGKQKLCPVTGKPLGSMGKPVKITVRGRTVFLCCDGCEDRLQANPEKYLPQSGDNSGTKP